MIAETKNVAVRFRRLRSASIHETENAAVRWGVGPYRLVMPLSENFKTKTKPIPTKCQFGKPNTKPILYGLQKANVANGLIGVVIGIYSIHHVGISYIYVDDFGNTAPGYVPYACYGMQLSPNCIGAVSQPTKHGS